MGRRPCCSKEGLNRGAWTALEDKILTAYIKAHGEGKWRNLPKRAGDFTRPFSLFSSLDSVMLMLICFMLCLGLKRCGKSCRLRWLNYLRPDIKRGNISVDEEELIIRLHKLLGNRWSLIAGRLPGRTDNEIKNYWNTTLVKKANAQSTSPQSKTNPPNRSKQPKNSATVGHHQVIRTKASRCTKVMVSLGSRPQRPQTQPLKLNEVPTPTNLNTTQLQQSDVSLAFRRGNGQELQAFDERDTSQFLNIDSYNFQSRNRPDDLQVDHDEYNKNVDAPVRATNLEEEQMFNDWINAGTSLEDNATLDLEAIASLLEAEDWPY
ncbi:hypothetical protein K2173_015978 [Erythroxylum novogranatense]|uniref:Uncharacterized protein n=1 Tax=Erythroxylum novogranatense TaxID=1862640 RepID=A0AAV8SF43_9ROSI|nr:hypothetical protein K2173_015978 [Erythroxylum novogranatense]